ncbi:Mitochondrial FAD-linked sulfhydryl oxidase ERV1 [Diplonema papillatum]|nr:Mitochondrial FAD-linked sulfhydryl oxidase ERV1 [Diplonema papillatum]|eukprot:gene7822-12016_t
MSGQNGQFEEAPTPEAIGHAGWTILHTVAAAYPPQPTAQQQKRMWDFLNTWSHVYPCTHCAAHMRIDMRTDPPNVNGKEGLSIWTCKLHNKVNDMVGKDPFPCNMDDIMRRWHPTYPNFNDQHQNGGFNDLPPFKAADGSTPSLTPATLQQPPPHQPTDGKTAPTTNTFASLTSLFKNDSTPAQMPKEVDPDMQSLLDMQCTTFCPKAETAKEAFK